MNCFVLFKLLSKFLFSLGAIDHKIKLYSYQNIYSPEKCLPQEPDISTGPYRQQEMYLEKAPSSCSLVCSFAVRSLLDPEFLPSQISAGIFVTFELLDNHSLTKSIIQHFNKMVLRLSCYIVFIFNDKKQNPWQFSINITL